MIIEKIEIKKFRGFENVEFNLGSQLTVIAGKNGTQKTTILGLLSQPFSISMPENPMRGEKPLCGGSFRSGLSEKFKFSETFDKPREHEWTLFFNNEYEPYTSESIPRTGGGLRFYKKGDHTQGAGFIQVPVIYLSLKRLLPIGEDSKLKENATIKLTASEKEFFENNYTKILLALDEKIVSSNYLNSPNKNTVGISTEKYDWKQNSTGQDNVGKILLAIISFKRLKEKYGNYYKGGILAIDELDAALYPGSQIQLLNALIQFASSFEIQIIFTTHSLSILENCCLRENLNKNTSSVIRQKQVKVIYLEKLNNSIELISDITFESILNRLNETISGKKRTVKKITVFTEDHETLLFTKALLKKKALSKLNYIDSPLGCDNLISLASAKVPAFIFPNSIVVLDGDVRSSLKKMNKLKDKKNFLVLPCDVRPENLIANYLYNLDDKSIVWKSIDRDFTKTYCFKSFSINEIRNDRDKAKKWFNSHLEIWGTNATKVINPWIKENEEEASKFISAFINVYNQFAKELALDKIEE